MTTPWDEDPNLSPKGIRRGAGPTPPPSKRGKGPQDPRIDPQHALRTGRERFFGEIKLRTELQADEAKLLGEFERKIKPPEPGFFETAKTTVLGVTAFFTRFDTQSGLNLSQVEQVDKAIRDLMTDDEIAAKTAAGMNFLNLQVAYLSSRLLMEWRRSVLNLLAMPQGRLIGSVDDLNKSIEPPLELRPEDKEWARGVIANVRADAPAVSIEGVLEKTAVQLRAEYAEQLDKRRSISAFGLAYHSGVSMNSYIKRIRQPQLLPGDILEDLRRILREADWEEGLIAEILSTADISELDLISARFEQQKRVTALMQQDLRGTTPEDLEELIRRGTIDSILQKGALGLLMLEPIEYYTRLIEKGPAALAFAPLLYITGGNPLGRGIQDLSPLGSIFRLAGVSRERQRLYQEWQTAFTKERTTGAGVWQALDFARTNSTMAGWEKFSQVMLLDPFTYFGWGAYGKILTPFSKKLGGAVTGIERGWEKTVDGLFLGIARGAYKIGGETVRMAINKEVKEFSTTLLADMGVAYGKPLKSANPTEVRNLIRGGLEDVIADPAAPGPWARVARTLLRRAPLDEGRIREILNNIGPGLDESMLMQDGVLLAVDDVFQHTVGLGGKTWDLEDAVSWLAKKLQVTQTDEAFERIRNEILKYQKETRAVAEAIIDEPYVPAMLLNAATHLEDVITKTRSARLAEIRSRQGALGSWLKRMGPEVILMAQSALDVVSRSVSRQYLLFTAYGFGNIVEVMIKSGLAGVTIPWGRYKFQAHFGMSTWRNLLIGDLNKATVGLLHLPEKFIWDTPSNLQIQLMRDATAHIRPGQRSVNSQRRWYDKTAADYAKGLDPRNPEGLLQETFIRKPSRIGLALEANYLTKQLYKRIEALAPEITAKSREIANEEMLGPLSRSLQQGDVERLINEMHERLLTGSKELVTDIVDDFHLGVIDQQHVNDILVKAKFLSPEIHSLLSEASFDNTLWANIDKTFDLVRERAWIDVLQSPQVMRRSFIDMADEFLQAPPKNADEMVHRIKIIQGLVEEYQTNLGIQFHLIQLKMGEFSGTLAKRAFLDANWDKPMGELMDAAETQVRRMAEQLRPLARKGVADSPFTALEEFIDVEEFLTANIRVMESVRAVRSTQLDAEKLVMGKFGGKVSRSDPRFEAFTIAMFEAREQAWSNGLPSIHRAWAQVESMSDQASGALLPSLHAVGDTLTPLDIATLFASHPHDLTRGLLIPERGMWRTRAEFQGRVMQRVRDIAEKDGVNVLDTGYTEEAVGRVYDQIISHVGSQHPLLNEIDRVRAEFIKYGQQRGAFMGPDAHEQLVLATDRIITRIEEDPLTAGMFLDEDEVVDIVTQQDHILASEMVDSIDAFMSPYHQRIPNPQIQETPLAKKPINPKRLSEEENRIFSGAHGINMAEKDKLMQELKAEGYDGIIKTIEADPTMMFQQYSYDKVYGFDTLIVSRKHVGQDVYDVDRWSAEINGPADELLSGIRAAGGDEAVQLEGLIDEAMEFLPVREIEDTVLRDLAEEGWHSVEMPDGRIQPIISPALPERLPEIEAAITYRIFRPTADEWQELLREKVTFEYLIAHWSSKKIKLGVDFPLRDVIGKITKLESMKPYRAHLRETLFAVYGDDVTVFRGVRASGETRMGGEEITGTLSTTSDPREAHKFGASWEGGFTDAGKINIDDVLAVGNLRENELIVDSALFRPWSEVINQGTRKGRSWRRDVRQPAFDRALESYSLDFPGYDNETIFNSVMKTIFPFWTYEAHRWPWLAREMLRHPGTVVNWGRYMDNTELGYIALPSNAPFGLADLQINLLRGSIWMGGMRRMLLQDFPEYYDNFPGVANAFDQASRLGFYPNIWVGGFMAAFGPRTGPAQLGELLPPIIQTPLDMYLAANPESSLANRLTETLFSNRFRDYMTAQYVSAAGFNGPEILRKIRLGDPITLEETHSWRAGVRKTATLNMFMTQAPFFRLRPQERLTFQREVELLIEEITGISVATQRDMRRAGLWLEDWQPLDPQHAQLLRDLDGWARWGGLTQHLRETMTGKAQAKWSRFWQTQQVHRDVNFEIQNSFDRRLALDWLGLEDSEGQVDVGVWEFHRRDLGEDNRRFFDATKEDPANSWTNPKTGKIEFVPVTLEERIETAELLGYDAPISHPIEEAQAFLFSKDIQDFVGKDPDTKNQVADWEAFYNWQDSVLDQIGPQLRLELEEWLSRNMSTAEKLRKSDWKLWVTPYKAIRNTAMAEFDAAEQVEINQFIQSSDVADIQRLREIERADGTKLISQYTTLVSTMRSNLRKIDPELDARLALWGEVGSFQTEAAERRFEELKYEYAHIILNSAK